MNLWHKKMMVCLIIGLLIGFMIGVPTGSYITMKAVARVGSSFLDAELIQQAIYQYQNNIAGCFPPKI